MTKERKARKSDFKWAMTGQHNGTLTKKQRAQSLSDRDHHARQLNRAYAIRLINPPIILRQHSIVKLPGTSTKVTDLKHPNGKPRYAWKNGSILKINP